MHPSQRTVAADDSRFKVLAAGRGWRKTSLAAVLAFERACRGQRVGWFCPSYKQTNPAWEPIVGMALEFPQGVIQIRAADREIVFPAGGRIEFRTADDPHALRSAGWDYAVFDECRELHPAAWAEVVRPRVVDRRGGAVFLSTPNGWDWFHELWEQAHRLPEWRAWQFPSHDNPHWPREELKKLEPGQAGGMSERRYRQEILAEFLPDGGGIFRNVRSSSTLAPQLTGRHVVVFFDPARTVDFDAVSVFHAAGSSVRQLYADRWHPGSWEQSLARLAKLRQFQGELHVDTSVGDESNDSWLSRIADVVGPQLSVSGFRFTQPNKQIMTDNIAMMLETGTMQMLDPAKCEEPMRAAVEAQILELDMWQAHKLPSGRVTYAGPSHGHDDMAIATITAAHIASENGTPIDRGILRRKLYGAMV